MGSGQTPDIAEVKVEVVEILKLMNELYDIQFIPVPRMTEIEPEIEFGNI